MSDDVWQSYPESNIDLDTQAFYEGLLVHELRVNRCGECGNWQYPCRPICSACWSFDVGPERVSGNGTVYLSMLLQQGPTVDGVRYPYPVVAVELEEQAGLRFTGTVLDHGESLVPIGTGVSLDWVQRGGAPWPVFRCRVESGEGAPDAA